MFITLAIVYIQISNTYLPEFLNMFIFSGNFKFETGLLSIDLWITLQWIQVHRLKTIKMHKRELSF